MLLFSLNLQALTIPPTNGQVRHILGNSLSKGVILDPFDGGDTIKGNSISKPVISNT
jgi:hypothetical protein